TTPTFAPKVDFPTQSWPSSVSIGDINVDGKPDVAVSNRNSNTTSILLNTTPTGATTPTFAPKVDFPTQSWPSSVSIGDINLDGKPDVAVTNRNSNTTSIFLNTTPTGATTPTFAPKVDFPTGGDPFSVSIGDINGDGKPDVAVANRNSNTTSILLNTTATGATTPTFAPKVDFTTGAEPSWVSIGDFNGDGKPDVATENLSSDTISILLNNTPKVSIAAGTTPTETGPTNGTFTITLDTPAPAGGLVINFDTTGSTATNPSHYSLTEGTNITAVTANTFTIAAGATTAVLNAVPVDDAIINPDETIKLNVTADTNNWNYFLDPVVANTTATLTITDNDDFPTVNLLVSPATSTETGSPTITVTATASSAVVGDQTVDVNLSGTATDDDFTEFIPASITIADGETTGSFTVNINDDGIVEGTETGTFTISNPSSGLVLGTTTTGEVTITESDCICDGIDYPNLNQPNSVENTILGGSTIQIGTAQNDEFLGSNSDNNIFDGKSGDDNLYGGDLGDILNGNK
ncbi:FG-GAP-like repeat-containing protein, partial [Microcoleus sp. OTE_8_concoct_300]|uniref:FG-GAP-like repeat-containing protein n=1 Tax=Microcoleus sp. OTE_8_concoct_300 TaxID=2964710 RepID=UPI00403F6E67